MTQINITPNPDRLYELLPALYRIADAPQGGLQRGQLRALLALVTAQADALRDDTQQVWDDFFVETAQRWAIPYLGGLIGNVALHDPDLHGAAATAQALFSDLKGAGDLRPPAVMRLRADVAKTIKYRRSKGTVSMLESLARDVTGWGAHAVEFFSLLDWNQHLEHLRLDCAGCPDLRQIGLGERAGGPWDSTTHTVDVRRINDWDGWYNISNIGFFLWRLKAFPLEQITARAIGGTTWRLTFSPLGQDVPLYSAGLSELGASGIAAPVNVQDAIMSSALFQDLAAPSSAYYGEGDGASIALYSNNALIPASDIACANLSNWTAFAQPPGTKVLIDAKRGRLVVGGGRAGQTITATYQYGFSAAMGGGTYERAKWLVAPPPPPVASVTTSVTDTTGTGVALQNALTARAGLNTIIEIGDNATYVLTTPLTLAPGESLTIQAKDTCRPHLLLQLPGGLLAIAGGGVVVVDGVARGASLTLGGLLIEGGLHVTGDLNLLRLLHTTLVPGRSVLQESITAPTGESLIVEPVRVATPINTHLQVQIAFSITGRLNLPATIDQFVLLDSIVDGILANKAAPGTAVSDAAGTSGPPAHIERSTLIGKSFFLKLDMASESIFSGAVSVDQRQAGCVRYSFVPRGSATPQQYCCQPALEIAQQTDKTKADAKKSGTPLPPNWDTNLAQQIAGWLVPTFESIDYGRPEFAQLRRASPLQIRAGAEDGSEMGAFCTLKQPQREANLRLRLDEYLPVGLEAGIIYVT